MAYFAMNRFQVLPGKEDAFVALWRDRRSFLGEVPGFVEFHLLRGDGGVFLSHSVWRDQAAFEAWTQSEAFAQAHRQGGSKGLIAGHPQFSGWEAVL